VNISLHVRKQPARHLLGTHRRQECSTGKMKHIYLMVKIIFPCRQWGLQTQRLQHKKCTATIMVSAHFLICLYFLFLRRWMSSDDPDLHQIYWIYIGLFRTNLKLKTIVWSSGLQPGVRVHPGVRETYYINRNETQEPPEPWTSSDPSTHKDSSRNWRAGMPETSSIISLTGQNGINNW
jgi:hypothetical protein